MKKFLFTLFALLMAGSLYAQEANENYLFIEDFEITEDSYVEGLLDAESNEFTGIVVPVAAHFYQYCSAWQVKFTMPEGLTVKNFLVGDAATIEFYNQMGQKKSLEASVTPNADMLEYVGITTAATLGYWKPDNKWVSYGVVKWVPGDYADMFYLFIEVDPDFAGGVINVHSEPSSGSDTRGEYITTIIPADKPCNVTVKKAAPEPTINNVDGVVTASVENDDPENPHTVVLEVWNAAENKWEVVEDGSYELPPATYEEQEFKFRAYTKGIEGVDSGDSPYVERTIKIDPKDKETVNPPTVVGQDNADAWLYNIVITPNGDGDLNYTITPSSVTPKETITDPATGAVTLVFEKGEEAVTVTVVAYTEEGATCAESDPTTEGIEIPALAKVETPVIEYNVDGNKITITATCATDGATIVLYDPEGNAVDNPAEVTFDPYEGYSKTWTAKATKEHMQDSETGSKLVTVEAINKKDAATPTIVGQKREGSKKLFDIIITPDPNTDGELVYTATPMGTVVRANAITIQYERGETDNYVDVTAYTKEGATYKKSETAVERIKVPKLDQVEEPEINYTVNGNQITVTATCETEGSTVVLVGPDGAEYPNGTATVTFDPYKGYDETWTATASAEDMLDNSADKEIKIDAKKVYEVDDPTITVDKTDPNKTVITIEATEGDLTYEITDQEGNPFNNYTAQVVDGKVVITIENGDQVVTVKVTATTNMTEPPTGYDEVKPGEAEEFVQIPQKPQLEQTAKPIINVTTGKSEFDDEGNVTYDGHWKEVTFTMPEGEDPNAVIEYCTGDPENEDDWLIWDREPLNFSQNGTYHVYARATADGKTTSEWNDVTVVVDAATGLNELTNGKAVAGVRYFNMAGQEMQEANGITIVVTTYTDGTTSAVKVIK